MACRKINDDAIDIIMKHEGCKLSAYFCPAKVLTIGYGHTGADVKQYMTITQEQADRLLLRDLDKFCDAVEKMVTVDLNDNQFGALVSLCFNIGGGALSKSTLIRKLNAGQYAVAAAEFPKWNKAGGKVLPGLVKRRADEQRLFLKGVA